MIGGVALFQQEIMLEQQREGVARTKLEGRYRGRVPTARAKSAEVIMKFKADQKPTEIANSVRIACLSVS